ncbi:MAG: hypothetical protein HQ475_04735 [SAR202 cluster bacterium]|nr:hypothetical protein [SAR202 cluster bacterium]
MWSRTDNGKEKRLTVVALRLSTEIQPEHALAETGEHADGGPSENDEDQIVPDTLSA